MKKRRRDCVGRGCPVEALLTKYFGAIIGAAATGIIAAGTLLYKGVWKAINVEREGREELSKEFYYLRGRCEALHNEALRQPQQQVGWNGQERRVNPR